MVENSRRSRSLPFMISPASCSMSTGVRTDSGVSIGNSFKRPWTSTRGGLPAIKRRSETPPALSSMPVNKASTVWRSMRAAKVARIVPPKLLRPNRQQIFRQRFLLLRREVGAVRHPADEAGDARRIVVGHIGQRVAGNAAVEENLPAAFQRRGIGVLASAGLDKGGGYWRRGFEICFATCQDNGADRDKHEKEERLHHQNENPKMVRT